MENSITTENINLHIDTFHKNCLELFKELSLDTLLYKISTIASYQSNACYCFCGYINGRDEYTRYHINGLTPNEMELLKKEIESHAGELHMIHSDQTICTTKIKETQAEDIFPNNKPYINSLLFVPIRHGQEKNGAILLMNKIGAQNFTNEDIEMIETLAVYAGLAINNAIAYEQAALRERELSKRNEDLALLNELAKLFASSGLNRDKMVEDSMEQIMGYLDIDISEFFYKSDDEKPNLNEYKMIFKKGHNLQESIFGFTTVKKGEGIVGKTIDKKTPYLLNDQELEILNQKKATTTRLNYAVCLPIITSEGGVGAICLATRIFEDSDINLSFLMSITTWISVLIENISLTRQQQKIAILEERDRIGMDLHDGVIQSIYGVGLTLENARLTAEKDPAETAKKIQTSIDALNATIRDIRSYIMNLKPDKLTHENIIQSLRRMANDFHANTLINTEFIPHVEHVENLTEEQINTFYLICQESLSNVSKYAKATKVTVSFFETPNRFVLEVIDNGIGFNPKEKRADTHHGVTNMHSRTKGLHGDIEIDSAPGEGTTIMAWLPNIKPEVK